MQKKASYQEFAALLKGLEYCNHIPPILQQKLCKRLGMPYKKKAFIELYKRVYIRYLKKYETTNATLEKITTIPHKFLCILKRQLEKEGIIEVYKEDFCPTMDRKYSF